MFAWGAKQVLVSMALEIGCRGYRDKTLTAEQLVDGLEQIGAGSVVVQVQDVLQGARVEVHPGETLDDAPRTTWLGMASGLSEREAEVITLVAQGYTNPEIAARMYITLNSLKTYIRSAYRKIGVERRSQAVRWGIENGMLPPHP